MRWARELVVKQGEFTTSESRGKRFPKKAEITINCETHWEVQSDEN